MPQPEQPKWLPQPWTTCNISFAYKCMIYFPDLTWDCPMADIAVYSKLPRHTFVAISYNGTGSVYQPKPV